MSATRTTARTLVMAAVMAVAGVATAPPSGAVPAHTSCKGYGQLVASEAHAKILVPELHSLPRGAIDDLIGLVQVGGTFGDEVIPAFCVPK